ncbi:DUF3311 domain-containing protein [Fictibacillus enclensis]|uniref:DUF3311 domain-containing protein n=1 Tax=Fictibacillus enclensis TaxID=1017270 RepID=UPI0024BFA139|nr:DUF3311 domain-containing protein [Fictibacillus enclensis]WHY70093.1 DUF3311 domain-containing protein [Fictibacillus enclensis]
MKSVKLLLFVPFIGLLGFIPVANRIEPYVFGLPFLLFYIVFWMVLSSILLTVIYKLDPENQRRDSQ